MIETSLEGALSAISDHSTPLVLDLHADWCGYCIKTRPHLEQISHERDESLRIVGVDIGVDTEALIMFKVEALPAIFIFRDGVEIARRGSGTYEELTAWLAEHEA